MTPPYKCCAVEPAAARELQVLVMGGWMGGWMHQLQEQWSRHDEGRNLT
jgi:hypothetical protein